MMQYIAFAIYRDTKRSSLVLTLEELSPLSFWICGHKDGRHAGVHHFHVGEEFVDGLGLSNLPMGHELVGTFVTLLSHVFVRADGSF